MHNPSGSHRQTALYDHCPKCQGQYWRDGTTCKCYMCCFEWDVRDPVEKVLVRARRRAQGERPDLVFWDDPPGL